MNVSVDKQDQSTPRLFRCTKAVFRINPVISHQFGIADIHNSAPFHQSRNFNIKFIFHLRSVLCYYWSVSGESSYRKKQKYINSLSVAHIRENQTYFGKRIFPGEMTYKILSENVSTLHTYIWTRERKGKYKSENINSRECINNNVKTFILKHFIV